jgi:hypothetical protein
MLLFFPLIFRGILSVNCHVAIPINSSIIYGIMLINPVLERGSSFSDPWAVHGPGKLGTDHRINMI